MSPTQMHSCVILRLQESAMNWVGGARSRIKQKSERRTQKDYFERKRLQAKAQKARPQSPGGKRLISQDLLFLQTLSNAHDGNRVTVADPSKPRAPQKVNLAATRKGQRRLDHGLELPMSPIGNPSSLDLLDGSCSLSFYYHDDEQPTVSTQKISCDDTMMVSGPPAAMALAKQCKVNQSGKDTQSCGGFIKDSHKPLNTSCLTDSVFSPPKRLKSHVGNLQHPPRQASLEWLQPNAEEETKKQCATLEQQLPQPLWKSHAPVARQYRGDPSAPRQSRRTNVFEELLSTKRQKRTLEDSFDHETPFNFGYTLKPQNPLQPKANGSLLQFHQNQAGNKQCAIGFGAKGNGTQWKLFKEGDQGMTAFHHNVVSKVSPQLEMHNSIAPHLGQNGVYKTLSVSSLLDEEPLFKEEKTGGASQFNSAKSTSTSFNESVFRPILKANYSPVGKAQSRREYRHRLPSPDGTYSKREKREKGSSAFERMMHSFESSCSSHSPGSSATRGEMAEQEKIAGPSVTKSLAVMGKGGHHKEWMTFVSGKKPVAGDRHLIGGKEDCTDPRNGCAKPSKGRGKLYPAARSKNISVIEELLCLDEEISSSLESDVTASSQDITLTPGLPIDLTEDPIKPVRVPDIDSDDLFLKHSHCDGRRGSMDTHTAGRSDEECDRQTPSESLPCSVSDDDSISGNSQGRAFRLNQVLTAYDEDSGEKTTATVENETQTEPSHIPMYREVSCECDIWTRDMVHLPVKTKSVGSQTALSRGWSSEDMATQTSPVSNMPQVQAGVSPGEQGVHMKDEQVQTEAQKITSDQNTEELKSAAAVCPELESAVSISNQNPSGPPLNHQALVISDPKNMNMRSFSATAVATTQELGIIKIAKLTEELDAARNALAWQSLKMKLYEVDHSMLHSQRY